MTTITDTASPVLIGLTGRLGTGKSTLATILAEMIPDARVVAFADALKEDSLNMLQSWLARKIDAETVERLKGACFGPIWQGYGELLRQTHGRDYWIQTLAFALPARAIVADVRYENEAQWIKGRGGVLVAVDGPCRREGDTRSPGHPSEAGAAACRALAGLLVTNEGTLADLRRQAEHIARIAVTLGRATVGGSV